MPAKIFKVDLVVDVIPCDLVAVEESAHLPKHDGSEYDAIVHEWSDGDFRKEKVVEATAEAGTGHCHLLVVVLRFGG
jgi:hypothetical protein